MKRTIHHDVWTALVLIGCSIFVYAASMPFPKNSGSFPRVFSVLLFLCSLFILISGIGKTLKFRRDAGSADEYKPPITRKSFSQVFLGYAFVVAYVVLVNFLGFFVASGLFVFGMMYFLKLRRWGMMLIVTFCALAAIHFIFVMQLKVALPQGFLL